MSKNADASSVEPKDYVVFDVWDFDCHSAYVCLHFEGSGHLGLSLTVSSVSTRRHMHLPVRMITAWSLYLPGLH